MNRASKIYIAGHGGMVGSAIARNLKSKGYTKIVGKRSSELDLTRQSEVEKFFNAEKPEYVFLAAAKVGGIHTNNIHPAEFLYINAALETNVIHSAYLNDVKKLLFTGAGCVYPRESPQPIKEEYLMTGPFEKTNEAYAIAKLAGLKMCEYYNRQYGTSYISCMPINLYGAGDNFHIENSHVVPALIRKVCEAKERGDKQVVIWGTGSALREFMHVDDMADACVFLMENYNSDDTINVGTGQELSILELVKMIARIAEFDGEIVTDPTKPDGMPRRLVDSSRLFSLGWKPKITLEDGLHRTYEDYLKNRSLYRQ
ncbi:MAG: GDP-L-fucose synthase [Oscillospiraceae bacterium]|jgi:GDP-L-fucose synthase|nr:GDP-L-fucose synthase [Oscillospiraceae bacterium]